MYKKTFYNAFLYFSPIEFDKDFERKKKRAVFAHPVPVISI